VSFSFEQLDVAELRADQAVEADALLGRL
jgi:hypothetical protein